MEKQTVIWAIDPFENETRLDPSKVSQLMHWIHISNYRILPVHILPPSEDLPEELAVHESSESSKAISAAKKAIEQVLKTLKISNVLPTQILFQSDSSRKGAVSTLLEFSEGVQAPWIIVSSHGRSGIHRLVLGSFAENLLLESKCPIYFLTHGGAPKKRNATLNRVLFATDFSNFSREAFLSLLQQAIRSKLEIVLFHDASVPISMLASAGLGSTLLIEQDFLPTQVKWAEEESLQWKALAEERGISLRFVVKRGGVSEDVGKAILATAETEEVDIVALASVSGALTSLVVGSVARDVFRANLFPVWIYGMKCLKRPSGP